MADDLATRPDPTSPSVLRRLFAQHGFRPRRGLGQTFLVDGNIVRKIVRAARLSGQEPVVEVGAGAGAVTRELVRQAGHVVAIELDARLIALLRETVGETAEILEADVLAVDWQAVLHEEKGARWRIVANLPYSITGPALMRLLDAADRVDRLVIMIQREVAERVAAAPGSRRRGVLSVFAQAACEVEVVGTVPRTCFWPRPRVDSSILALSVRRPSLVPEPLHGVFREVVNAAFGARRKTLANALSQGPDMGLSKQAAGSILEQCDIDSRRRAESLSVQEFVRLARGMSGNEAKDRR